MATTFNAFTRATISHCNGVWRSDCERAVGSQGAHKWGAILVPLCWTWSGNNQFDFDECPEARASALSARTAQIRRCTATAQIARAPSPGASRVPEKRKTLLNAKEDAAKRQLGRCRSAANRVDFSVSAMQPATPMLRWIGDNDLMNVCFGALSGLKSDISRSPRSANSGHSVPRGPPTPRLFAGVPLWRDARNHQELHLICSF